MSSDAPGDAAQEYHDGRFLRLQTRVMDMDDRLFEVQKRIKELQKTVNVAHGVSLDTQGVVKTVDERFQAMAEEVKKLPREVGQSAQQEIDMSAAVEELRGHIAADRSAIEALATSLSQDLRSNLDAVRASMTEFLERQRRQEERTETLEQSVQKRCDEIAGALAEHVRECVDTGLSQTEAGALSEAVLQDLAEQCREEARAAAEELRVGFDGRLVKVEAEAVDREALDAAIAGRLSEVSAQASADVETTFRRYRAELDAIASAAADSAARLEGRVAQQESLVAGGFEEMRLALAESLSAATEGVQALHRNLTNIDAAKIDRKALETALSDRFQACDAEVEKLWERCDALEQTAKQSSTQGGAVAMLDERLAEHSRKVHQRTEEMQRAADKHRDEVAAAVYAAQVRLERHLAGIEEDNVNRDAAIGDCRRCMDDIVGRCAEVDDALRASQTDFDAKAKAAHEQGALLSAQVAQVEKRWDEVASVVERLAQAEESAGNLRSFLEQEQGCFQKWAEESKQTLSAHAEQLVRQESELQQMAGELQRGRASTEAAMGLEGRVAEGHASIKLAMAELSDSSVELCTRMEAQDGQMQQLLEEVQRLGLLQDGVQELRRSLAEAVDRVSDLERRLCAAVGEKERSLSDSLASCEWVNSRLDEESRRLQEVVQESMRSAEEQSRRSVAEQASSWRAQETALQQLRDEVQQHSSLQEEVQRHANRLLEHEDMLAQSCEEAQRLAADHGAQLELVSGLLWGSSADGRMERPTPGTGGLADDSDQDTGRHLDVSCVGEGGRTGLRQLVADHDSQLQAVNKLLWGTPFGIGRGVGTPKAGLGARGPV